MPVAIQPKPVLMQPLPATFHLTEMTVPETETSKRKQPVPYSTQKYKKQKLEKEAKGIFSRKYTKTAEFRKCRQCGKDEKGGDHVNYYMNIYCPEKCTLSLEEWKAPLKLKYAKKSKKNSCET